MSPRHLYLHYVSREPQELRLGIGRDELAALVESERRQGLRAASLAAPFEPGTFTLSFDDAHVSVRTHAAPVLSALGVPATLFVATAYVGTSPSFLDWDDLRALRDAGWTIGAHSHTHARAAWRFYDEGDAAHAARLRDETRRCREELERQLDVEVSLYAYPFGEDPPAAREAVRAAGFARAFTVRPSLEWSGDPLSIPRLDALADRNPPGTEAPTELSVVVPAYERAEILAEVVTRLASQTYPEDRYEVLVVDDGSKSDLAPIFEEMPDNVRLSRPKGFDATFRAGQARQWGAEHARFDHLAFLDADVAVGPDFLWHLDWVHRREPNAVVLGYLSGYNLHDLGFVHTLDAVRGRDLDEVAVIPDRSREPTLRSCLDNLDWLSEPWALCYTGNVSMPKELLTRVGGFAQDFTGWGLEDVDLGYRLHRAGGRFVFSRWAFGAHLVDPSEPAPRNPFRKPQPVHADFEGYLRNLAKLERHGVPVRGFAERARADIEETCARPTTVGIEHGGASRFVSRYHRSLHRTQPGGVFTEELLDRVAYAQKVGARSIYLLGGEPAEHPGFSRLLRAAKATGAWVSMQTLGHAFARPGAAEEARSAGLDGAVVVVVAFDEAIHDAVHEPGAYARFAAGWAALRASGLELAARVFVCEESAPALGATLAHLREVGVAVDEVCVVDPLFEPTVRTFGIEPVAAAP